MNQDDILDDPNFWSEWDFYVSDNQIKNDHNYEAIFHEFQDDYQERTNG